MRVLLLIAFTFISVGLGAKEADPIEALKLRLDSIKTLSGQFSQTIHDAKGEVVAEPSKGSFSMKRPGYFLWESEDPYAQLVIGSPEFIKVYEPDLEQLTTYPRGTKDESNPVHLLSGDLTTLRAAFKVQKSSSEDISIYKLQPVKSDTSFKDISFHFSKKTLIELSFVDKLDQITRIEFTQLSLNTVFKEGLFDFSPPKGTDIIVNE